MPKASFQTTREKQKSRAGDREQLPAARAAVFAQT
jgi:hypothetical protein